MAVEVYGVVLPGCRQHPRLHGYGSLQQHHMPIHSCSPSLRPLVKQVSSGLRVLAAQGVMTESRRGCIRHYRCPSDHLGCLSQRQTVPPAKAILIEPSGRALTLSASLMNVSEYCGGVADCRWLRQEWVPVGAARVIDFRAWPAWRLRVCEYESRPQCWLRPAESLLMCR